MSAASFFTLTDELLDLDRGVQFDSHRQFPQTYLLHCPADQCPETALQVVTRGGTDWVKLTIELLLQSFYLLPVALQYPPQSFPLELITLVPQQHLRDCLPAVQRDLLQPNSRFLEGGGVIQVENHHCCLCVTEVVVNHSSIPLVSRSVPQLQGVVLSLVRHPAQEDVNPDGGLWLLLAVVATGVFEDEGGLPYGHPANDDGLDEFVGTLAPAITHIFKKQAK